MTTTFPELATMATWAATTATERESVQKRLVAKLGPEFEDVQLAQPTALVEIRHRATAIGFVPVPGGSFRRGISGPEEQGILGLARPALAGSLRAAIAHARPVAEVHVPPFLLARAPVLTSLSGTPRRPGPIVARGLPLLAAWDRATRPDYDQDTDDVPMAFTAAETARVLHHVPFRLPSESEWEYVARVGGDGHWIARPEDGLNAPSLEPIVGDCVYTGAPSSPGTNRLGVWGLLFGEWVADAWHDDYDGAPNDGSAWSATDRPGVARGGAGSLYPWQHGAELWMAHAGARHRVGDPAALPWNVRFAISIEGPTGATGA